MARKKKKVKSTRARASTVRQDYRKGGRVQLQEGGDAAEAAENEGDQGWYPGKYIKGGYDYLAGLGEERRAERKKASQESQFADPPVAGTEYELKQPIGEMPYGQRLKGEQLLTPEQEKIYYETGRLPADYPTTGVTIDTPTGKVRWEDLSPAQKQAYQKLGSQMDAPDFSGFESKGVVGDPSRQGQGPTSAQMAAMKMNQAVDESGLNYEAQLEANAERRAIQHFRDTGEWPDDKDYYYKDSATESRPSPEEAERRQKKEEAKKMAIEDQKKKAEEEQKKVDAALKLGTTDDATGSTTTSTTTQQGQTPVAKTKSQFESGRVGVLGGAVETPKADVTTLTEEEVPKYETLDKAPLGFKPDGVTNRKIYDARMKYKDDPRRGLLELGFPDPKKYHNPETGQVFAPKSHFTEAPPGWVEGLPEDYGAKKPARVEAGITAEKDVEQLSRYEFELDEKGNPKLDEKGDPIIKKDDDGNPILRGRVDEPDEKVTVDTMSADTVSDSDIKVAELFEPERDADGNPIPGSVKKDEEGKAIARADLTPAQYSAIKAGDLANIVGAHSIVTDHAATTEIRALTERAAGVARDWTAEDQAKASNVDFVISDGAFVDEVTGVGGQVSPTADAEVKSREAITGDITTAEQAQIVNTLGYEAAKRSKVTGVERTGDAANMIEQTAALPPEIAAAIVEDPATVTAQLDEEDVTVQAAIAALPNEALMSAQMESLIGGLESGTVPAWAKPAVDQVTQMMAQRGLDVSSVARDSLFNAIIQSAMPIAQNNAQALQTRAAQNLSNEQQANLAQATQDMQRRMANLANRQTAASQTAQMSQQMRVMQSQFKQQAVMTTAEQQQQMRIQNLQNQQQGAVIRSQNQQATNAQNLSNDQQMELANLEIMNQTERENMTAEQKFRLVEYQTAADFMSKNAAFTQDMRKANLSTGQQMRLANLTAQNQASSENLSAEQQTELANLNKRMQMNIRNAELAQQMGIAQLNVDQQRAMQNASMVAGVDMTKFTTEQQVELANSKFLQSMTMTKFNADQQAAMQNATALASLDLATVDQRTKLTVENARNFLQMDLANLNNKQQAVIMDAQLKQQRILSDQAATNASRQFNATSENQTNQYMRSLASQMSQFNAQQSNAMKQFNSSEENKMTVIEEGNTLEADKFNNQLNTQIDQYNSSLDFQRDQWNAANAQAVEQSNVAWRRQANTIDTAAKNAVNQQNTANAFNLTRDAQNALWQELRDKATFDYQGGQNQLDRISRLLATALSNESISANKDLGYNGGSLGDLFDMLLPD